MANALDIALHALTAETANGAGAWVDIGDTRSAVVLDLFISASTGETTVYVETSDDQSGVKPLAAFAAASGVLRQTLKVDRCGRYVRVRWTVETSATFSVLGEAHT